MTTIIGANGQGQAGGNGPPQADLIKESSAETFADDVIQASMAVPVIVDFWAPWCGPCKMMGPVFDQLAYEWQGRIRLCKLNVDENPQTAARFQTRSIPTLLVFDNGLLKDTMIGALPKHQIVQKMAAYL